VILLRPTARFGKGQTCREHSAAWTFKDYIHNIAIFSYYHLRHPVPSEGRCSVASAGRGAVADGMQMRGARRTPRRRRPKPQGPGATGWCHRASWRQRRNSVPTARRCRGSQRWVGPVTSATARGVLKTPPTGGLAEQASNTARGTSARRRTCGLQDRWTALLSGIAVPLRRRERPEPAGPTGPRRPARPRTSRVRAHGLCWSLCGVQCVIAFLEPAGRP
jgi:hypothetical protein